MIAGYDRWLRWVLRHQGATLVVAVLTLALTALLYVLIPKGLFPTQDTGQLQARLEASQDVSYARMAELQQSASRAILQDPDVQSLSSFVGVDAANNTMLNTGRMLINLRPQRDSQEDIMQRLRERVRAHMILTHAALYLKQVATATRGAEGMLPMSIAQVLEDSAAVAAAGTAYSSNQNRKAGKAAGSAAQAGWDPDAPG